MRKKVKFTKRRNFATSLVFTEVTKLSKPEIGVVNIYLPAQYFSEMERLIRAEFGALKAYNQKPDKKNPFLQVRTGKANNTISNQIYNWVNNRRSQAYYENPNLSTDYSASQQGVSVSNNSGSSQDVNSDGNNNTLLYAIGGIVLIVVIFIMLKRK